jgi:cytochrome c oxidase subunit 2
MRLAACGAVLAAVVRGALAQDLPGYAPAIQSALAPAGPQAAHIHALWHLMLGTCATVFVLVVAMAWIAVLRRRRHDLAPPELESSAATERRFGRVVAIAVGLSALGLVTLVVASIATDRALAALPHDDALHIELTGHQWWWEATYDDPDPSKMFNTANELHIPVGRPVIFTLKADDVIHSLWVPNLHGKTDLIPGRTATTLMRADRAGIFRGQCAEFCGYEHAFMSLLVIAEPPDQFAAWQARQRQPAAESADAHVQAGRRVFETGTCAMCHAVEGTLANARHAPDLTHVASRLTLGAVTLVNTPANRAAWIADPQRFKPGVNMPAHNLPPEQLAALLDFLTALQ